MEALTRQWRRYRGLGAVGFVLCLGVTGCRDRETPAPPTSARAPGATCSILIDNIHSPKRAPDHPMVWNDYRYSAVHGEKRLFDFLVANGFAARFVTPKDAPALTAAILRDANILFIDQIAQNCKDYEPAEIDAIVDFVAAGGSLLVVADHTNVYDHARRANALLKRFGVEVSYTTAVERPPSFVLDDIFWVVVRSFRDHPTTRAVQAIFLGAGATLATQHGVAFLSEHGFGDAWNPNQRDQTGNGVVEPREATGPLPVVAAGEHGRGRFAVFGDETLLGNARLFLANNFELVANTFEWLARRESQTPPLRERMSATLRVGFDLEHCNWNIAGNACASYLPFYMDFNRGVGVVSRGLLKLGERCDVLVFTDPEKPLEAPALASVRSHLEGGGTVLLLTDIVRSRPGTCRLLKELLPDIVFTGRRNFGVEALPASVDLVPKLDATDEFPLVSQAFDATKLRIAGHEYPAGARCGYDIDRARPYLRQLTVSGGQPLLQARAGTALVDLARIYPIGAGRLVVFFQDGAFRNETLGWERLPAGPHNEDAHRVVFEMVRWLKSLYPAAGAAAGTAGEPPSP